MSATYITVQGNVVADVTTKTTESGVRLARFRLASTPVRPGKTQGEWLDGPTAYYAVTCWRRLADNAGESLRIGQPVIVVGRLTQRPYEHEVDGKIVKAVSMDIEATSVGHDLSMGVSNFQRVKSQAVRLAEQRAMRDVAEVMAEHPAGSAREFQSDRVA